MNIQDWKRFAEEFNGHMNSPGAFLTAAHDGKVNTMTIGWGSAGIFWTKPVLTVPVRFTRFTRELIEKSGCFTVTIPKEGELTKELAFCGVKSGRDMDKLTACGLAAAPAHLVSAPVISAAGMHIECRVVFKSDMGKLNLDAAIDSRFYNDHNYHTLYYGEVVDFYEI